MMPELEPSKPFRPIKPDTRDGALDALVGFLNNPLVTGAVVEKNLTPSPVPIPSTTPPPIMPPPDVVAPPSEQKLSPPLGRKIFLTGRLCSGKDYVAAAIGADIFGFADPIYSLAEYLLNVKVSANFGKDAPGVRKFLQIAGQWGRNEISADYPHTIERAMFCLMVRSLANQNCLGPGVEWGLFGLTADLWIDGLLKRAESNPATSRICVTNCRFENEYRRLGGAGYQHWHIVCSPASWLARLAGRKLDAKSPVISDMSEKLAADLNSDLTRKLSENKAGPKMRVVWSDTTPPPSNRIYSLDEFKSLV